MTSRFRHFSHRQRAFQNALWSADDYIRRGEHRFKTVRDHLGVMTEEAEESGDDALLAALEASRQQLTSIRTRLDRLYAILEDQRAPMAAAEAGVHESALEPGSGDLGQQAARGRSRKSLSDRTRSNNGSEGKSTR